MIIDPSKHRIHIRPTSGQPSGVVTSRVNNIPSRSLLSSPALTRIIDTKALHHDIPNGLECLDQDIFAKRYPDVIKNQIAKQEVGDIEVGS